MKTEAEIRARIRRYEKTMQKAMDETEKMECKRISEKYLITNAFKELLEWVLEEKSDE